MDFISYIFKMDSLKTILTDYIDFTEPHFIDAIQYSFLCFLGWVILPHLQFEYKLLSKLTNGNQAIASDFLAYFLIYTGTTRNHFINQAILNSKKMEYGVYEIPVQILAYIMMIFGIVLVTGSFYRLGLRGMYFGDHFGFLFKEKITQFPYNYFPNAQYVGTTAMLIGYSLTHHSAAGIFIALLVYLLYQVLTIVEFRKLKVFYPTTDKKYI
jgi:phosphatidylethanolamine/phosphatidyl-N-methylethanolamine N-methyltransferase